jgi:hypothetical protein
MCVLCRWLHEPMPRCSSFFEDEALATTPERLRARAFRTNDQGQAVDANSNVHAAKPTNTVQAEEPSNKPATQGGRDAMGLPVGNSAAVVAPLHKVSSAQVARWLPTCRRSHKWRILGSIAIIALKSRGPCVSKPACIHPCTRSDAHCPHQFAKLKLYEHARRLLSKLCRCCT